MSVNRSDFKAAFSVNEQVSEWLSAAVEETRAALERLARTVTGWQFDGTDDGWKAFEQQRAALAKKVYPLADSDDPAAALSALAPLKAEALSADEAALSARRQQLSERAKKVEEKLKTADKQLGAIDAFSEADAIVPERQSLRRLLAEAQQSADRCAFTLAEEILGQIQSEATAAAKLMVACRNARNEQWNCVVNTLLSLKSKGVGEVFGAELAQFEARSERITELIAERKYEQAVDLCVRFSVDIQQLDDMLARQQSCSRSIADLTGRLKDLPPFPEQGEIAAALKTAGSQAEQRDYDSAVSLLADLTRRIGAAEDRQDHLDELEQRLSALGKDIEALRAHPRSKHLGGALDGLGREQEAVAALLQSGAAATTEAGLDRLKARIASVTALAEQSGQAAGTVSECLADRSTDPSGAAEKLREALKALQSNPHSDIVTAQLTAINSDLDEASAASLKRAGRAFVQASQLLARHAAFLAAHKTASDEVKSLSVYGGIGDAIAALTEKLKAASECAGVQLYDDGEVLLDEVLAGCQAAVQQARLIEDWGFVLEEADQTFEFLWTHKNAAKADKELKSLRSDFDRAQKMASSGQHAEATDLLERIIPQGEVLAVRLDMLDARLDRESLDALLRRPDGPKMLDEVVKELGGDLPERAMEQVLEKRFKMKVDISSAGSDDTSSAAVSLQHIYTMLSQVPEAHVKGNSNLGRIELYKNLDGESTYNYGEDSMTLQAGRAEKSRPVPLLPEDETAKVDPDCRPKEDVTPSYFDWATLHEVGHSVDFKLGFMKARAGDSKFGGWSEHGADVGLIAEKASSALDFDEEYIRQTLQGRTAEPPPLPDDVEESAWRKKQKAVDDWCAAVKDRLWDDVAKSRACALDGVVYQEAYPNLWVSYPLAARTAALSAYQFRSPIEWFAELYAGYHSGLLKDSHPARSWLEAL